MAEVSSISRVGKYEPFDLQVGRGQISYHTPINVQGYNSAPGSIQLEGVLIKNG